MEMESPGYVSPGDRLPLPMREERQASDDKMKTNGTRILPDIKSRFIFDPDPFLDDDFDGLEDILAEDLIAELGNDAQWIPSPSTS